MRSTETPSTLQLRDRCAPPWHQGRDRAATDGRRVGDRPMTFPCRFASRLLWRRGAGGLGEGIRHQMGMDGQRPVPRLIERGAGQLAPEPMRAGPRHARRARGDGHMAAVQQDGEEEALSGGRPVRAIDDAISDGRAIARGGGGLLFHLQG